VNDVAYTELMNIFVKIVFAFRRYFVFDKPKKGDWLGKATPNDPDIIDIAVEEAPYDVFNQESLLIGLKVCAV
jgi:hypothetical protein